MRDEGKPTRRSSIPDISGVFLGVLGALGGSMIDFLGILAVKAFRS
jgi:hypothetical protein